MSAAKLWGAPLASMFEGGKALVVRRAHKVLAELRQVGEGTYGQVYHGKNLVTNEFVALKKVRLEADPKYRLRGIPHNALREIRLLKSKCSHPNIVKLMEVATSTGEDDEGNIDGSGFIYLVFEYVDHDLSGLLTMDVRFDLNAVRCVFKQLVDGLEYIHEQGICHRDLKCSNLLLTNNFVLKLADFGLARELTHLVASSYTNKVITLWYRPPEVLLGDTAYGFSVDMWSAGCILVELLRHKPLLQGTDELGQLKLIFELFGTPQPNGHGARLFTLPRMHDLAKMAPVESSFLAFCQSRNLDYDATMLANRLLDIDPDRRITARQCKDHVLYKTAPLPERMGALLVNGSQFHEWEMKRDIKRKKAAVEQAKQEVEVRLRRQQCEVGSAWDGAPLAERRLYDVALPPLSVALPESRSAAAAPAAAAAAAATKKRRSRDRSEERSSRRRDRDDRRTRSRRRERSRGGRGSDQRSRRRSRS